MKKILLGLVFGFLLGATLTGLASPSVIAWYFDPPTSIGISCKEAVSWGISAYQKILITGGFVGLISAIALLIIFRDKNKANTVG